MTGAGAAGPLELDRVRREHARSAGVVRRTPVVTSRSIAERFGAPVVLKAESLQRTGSFKLRGALCKLRALPDGVDRVVAGSAGNHAQALAYAARVQGLSCEIHMPRGAAVSKLSAVRAFGADVEQGGASVDECVERARAVAAAGGAAFVHPFDDPDVVAGQAGVGLEIAEQVADLAQVVVPVGGGGLASGVALAIKALRPEVRIVAVQAERCASLAGSLRAGEPVAVDGAATTLADGIAIKRPGALTLPILERWVDEVVEVSESAVADAMVLVLQRAKLVVEGAGAAAVAAIASGAVRPPASGTTVAILSGGNVDVGVLAAVAARAETSVGRRAHLFARIVDRPGRLSALLAALGERDANVLEIGYLRDGLPLAVGEAGVSLTVELPEEGGADALVDRLRAAGHDVHRSPWPQEALAPVG